MNSPHTMATPRNLDGEYHSCASKRAVKGIYSAKFDEGQS